MQLERDAMINALNTALQSKADDADNEVDQAVLTGLIILDVRDFRELNQSFGVECGDSIIQQIYQRLEQINHNSPQAIYYFYLGNDEFGIVLPELKSPGLAILSAENIASLFKNTFEWQNHTLKITINSGIAYNYDKHQNANKIIMDAELALKQAKKSNQTYILLGKNEQKSSNQLKWELLNELHQAIEQDELLIHYQPKLSLKTKKTTQAEALIRWPTAERGLLFPDITIPLIEHLGSELELVKWLVNTTLSHLSQLSALQHNNLKDFGVSINIPANSVTGKSLYQVIYEALSLWDVPPSCLTIEITEDVLINDKEKAFDYLSKLRETGVRVSIDDFGTGYSSLAYFKHIPADELKIDQAFVKNMTTNEGDKKIVKLVIDLAHTFDLTVVAEGVEDQETLDLLEAMGCDYAQGYAISEALPASDFKDWLLSQHKD